MITIFKNEKKNRKMSPYVICNWKKQIPNFRYTLWGPRKRNMRKRRRWGCNPKTVDGLHPMQIATVHGGGQRDRVERH